MTSKKYLFFFLKLAVLIVPAGVILSILRTKPGVQEFMSLHFPIYHLAKGIMVSSQKFLGVLGYTAVLTFDNAYYHYSVFALQIPGGVKTYIGFSCLGIGVMWVFASLIMAWTGKAMYKLMYILSGFAIIFVLNVARMSYLTWYGRDGLNFTEKNLSLFNLYSFDHHALFNFFVYLIIFGLFILWVEVFSKKEYRLKSHDKDSRVLS